MQREAVGQRHERPRAVGRPRRARRAQRGAGQSLERGDRVLDLRGRLRAPGGLEVGLELGHHVGPGLGQQRPHEQVGRLGGGQPALADRAGHDVQPQDELGHEHAQRLEHELVDRGEEVAGGRQRQAGARGDRAVGDAADSVLGHQLRGRGEQGLAAGQGRRTIGLRPIRDAVSLQDVWTNVPTLG